MAIKGQIDAALARWRDDLARSNSEWDKAGQEFRDGFFGMAALGLGPSGDKADLQPSFLKMGKALIRMNNIAPVFAPELGEFYKALREAEEELKEISKDADYQKDQARARYAKSLIDALAAKVNSASELANRSALYPDLYKNAWLTFALPPARDRTQLMANMAALKDFSDGVAVPSDMKLQKPGVSSCVGAIEGWSDHVGWRLQGTCAIIFPNDHKRILTGVIDGEMKLRALRLPLLVIDPFTSGQKTVDTRGFTDIHLIAVD